VCGERTALWTSCFAPPGPHRPRVLPAPAQWPTDPPLPLALRERGEIPFPPMAALRPQPDRIGLDIFPVIIINVHMNVHDGLPMKPAGCANGCPQRGGSGCWGSMERKVAIRSALCHQLHRPVPKLCAMLLIAVNATPSVSGHPSEIIASYFLTRFSIPLIPNTLFRERTEPCAAVGTDQASALWAKPIRSCRQPLTVSVSIVRT
jgi:hypothetical protein